jgi:hypothetical protein
MAGKMDTSRQLGLNYRMMLPFILIRYLRLALLCFPAQASSAALWCVSAEGSFSFVRDQTWLYRHSFPT